jgi:hypothetical protein
MNDALHTAATIVHLASAAVGVGTATVTDILFFRFLRDYRISRFEEQVLRMIHPVLWAALAVLIASGIVLVLGNPERYLTSSKFQLKMIVVSVIALNGALLHASISPRLRSISFGGRHSAHHEGELLHLRRAAFASGAVSITSWYAALVLGALRTIPITLVTGVAVYLGVLGIAVIAAVVMEAQLRMRASRNAS